MSWWHYLLLVNFYLVLFFVFYALLLSKETFFHLNRVYLVAASLLSFFIPLIQSNWVKGLFITQQVQSTIYSQQVILYRFKPVSHVLTLGNILTTLYITVSLFLFIRLLWQLMILKKAIEKPQPSAAYSFFKKISLGNNVSNQSVIAEHEQVHASQWHSVDVMIIEIVMIINWFNPVVYLYRFSIKYIHEFIADRQVLQSGTDKADYALLLLSQTFDTPTSGLVSNFYSSSLLRQRILMLQKDRSKRIALAKYGLSAPLFMLMLIFSSATVNNSKVVKVINVKAGKISMLPAASTQLLKDINTNITDRVVDSVQYIDAGTPVPIMDDFTSQREELSDLLAVRKSVDDISTTSTKGQVVFVPSEKQPEFPGGIEKFYEIVKSHIKYPDQMRESKIEGKAFVEFVVEKDGSVTNFKTVRDPGYGAEEETQRVMALLPKWNPGYQNGRPVSVKYQIPITFKLVAEPTTKDTASARIYKKNTPQFMAAAKSVTALDVVKTKVLTPVIIQPESSLTTMVATVARRIMGGLSGIKQDTDSD
ncbi:MAG: TonB family protein, partial [Sphingobacteriaceae bacterium]